MYYCQMIFTGARARVRREVKERVAQDSESSRNCWLVRSSSAARSSTFAASTRDAPPHDVCSRSGQALDHVTIQMTLKQCAAMSSGRTGTYSMTT